jgi:hypothetical protein
MHMPIRSCGPIRSAGLLLILIAAACSSAPAPTPTATTPPTKTAVPPTATLTATATATFLPTATPNGTATQQYTEFFSQVKDYYNKGYITADSGHPIELPDFSQEWAQLNWYQWWTLDRYATDFVLNAHFKWSADSPTPDQSGCGFIFALQENADNYAVFLANNRILFLQSKLAHRLRAGWEVGKTRGSGRVNFTSNPAEADFSLAVSKAIAYVYVDKQFVGEYTLSQDSNMTGGLAYTLYSGTKKGYGTRCEMTNVKLLVID